MYFVTCDVTNDGFYEGLFIKIYGNNYFDKKNFVFHLVL